MDTEEDAMLWKLFHNTEFLFCFSVVYCSKNNMNQSGGYDYTRHRVCANVFVTQHCTHTITSVQKRGC